MAPARFSAVALLLFCFAAAASARDLLEDAVSGEDIVPVMPLMTMLTAPAEGGMNRMLKPAAFMPGNAASNGSVAMGFLMAPLMLQRGPMGARFKAPPLNDTLPVGLAGLPPRVQRALGFAPLVADPPGACGGCTRLRAQRLTPRDPAAGAPPRGRAVSAMAKNNGILSRG